MWFFKLLLLLALLASWLPHHNGQINFLTEQQGEIEEEQEEGEELAA